MFQHGLMYARFQSVDASPMWRKRSSSGKAHFDTIPATLPYMIR